MGKTRSYTTRMHIAQKGNILPVNGTFSMGGGFSMHLCREILHIHRSVEYFQREAVFNATPLTVISLQNDAFYRLVRVVSTATFYMSTHSRQVPSE